MDTDRNNKPNEESRFSTVIKYFRKYRKYLVVGGVAVLATNAFLLYAPYVTKQIFDRLDEGAGADEILKLVLLILGLTAVAGFFRYLMRRTIIWMSRYIEYDLRNEIMAHLLKLHPAFYHENRTGDIMARMTNDLEAVRQMIGPGIMYITDAIIKLAIALTAMFYLSPRLTLFAILPLLVLPIAVNLVASALHKRSMKIQEHFSVLTTTAQENLAGIRVVKAYRQEKAETENFSKQSEKYIDLNMSLAKLQGGFMPLMRLTASMSYLLVFFFGGLAVVDDTVSLGTVVAFFAYLAIILWPTIALGWVLALYQRGTASLKRINEILHTEVEIRDIADKPYDSTMKGHIEFRNLRFRYNGKYVLDGINLTIEAGHTIGIIGLTGSGKTTLVSLIPRLYDVSRGQLFIDSVDINDWQLNALRSQIGFVTQEPFLFSDTVGNNINFGLDEFDLQGVEKASDTAVLSDDISEFPKGYDTVVGERGITLSGGQKQRAAIARAIIIDPAILILDDATSAVDTSTEYLINERIKNVLANRTAIIISHRVSAVKDADQIIYIKEGRIAQQGNHEELISQPGPYADLYRSQLLAQELESL